MIEMKRKNNEKKVSDIRAELSVIERERDILIVEYNVAHGKKDTAKLDDMLFKLEEYRKLIAIKRNEITLVRSVREDGKEGNEEKEEKRKFIRRCTRDNCQGFLSTAWKCGICEFYSCPKCFKIKRIVIIRS